MRLAGKIAAWVLGLPLALIVVLYLVLLVTPVPLPFVSSQVRNLIMTSMPEGSRIELGEMALALEDYAWPVIQFAPVVYQEDKSGARVSMEALEVGFSPWQALIGQPGARVTVVGPHLQVNQDLFGPRLATFNVVPDPEGGRPTVQVIEGADAFPEVGLSSEGVELRGDLPPSAMEMRSDNDWLVYNLEAAEKGIASIVEQAAAGRFSRLIIRDGRLDMNDALYGLFRTFEDIEVDLAAKPGKVVEGTFSADFGGTVMNGILERVLEDDGEARLKASVTNLDLASFLPFIDDPDSMASMVGPSALSIDVGFDAATGAIKDGLFHIDMTGTDLRVEDDYFPIATSIMAVHWEPGEGQFTMEETQVSVGASSGWMKGVFKLGMDERFGPTVAMAMEGRDVSIVSERGVPDAPFETLTFRGWSAPLYGAMGIEHFRADKADGAYLESVGRADLLRDGMGFQMDIKGDKISADDLTRLWPYFIAADSRDWFVDNVIAGRLKESTMHYNFPVGSLAKPGESKPLPKDSMTIDIVGEGVQIVPAAGMAPIAIDGETSVIMRDNNVTIAADGGTIATEGGSIHVANAALVMASETANERLIEISGDVSAPIPAILSLAKEQQPDALAAADLPFDLTALAGNLSLALVSTIVLDGKGEVKTLDYAANGLVQDFGSTEPLDTHTIVNGQLSFTASQDAFRITGQAEVDGLPADVVIEGVPDGESAPSMLLSATLDAEDFGKMGFDVSEFINGKITFVARPMPDQSIQIAVDLEKASLSIADLGLTKAAGVPGSLQAAVKMDGKTAELTQVDVAFGDVHLAGSIGFDIEGEALRAAEFTTFQLSPGDAARLSVAPLDDGGFKVTLRGEQLDLKPMLKRFFSLEAGSTGGVQATGIKGTIAIDAELTRALGFFRTTASNLDLDLTVNGRDIRNASLTAALGDDRSVSVTTNPTPNGRVMSVAFNDLGRLLRLLGVYPNVEGGSGTLVLETITAEDINVGRFALSDFAIIDEANVARIVGNHRESEEAVTRTGRMNFRSGEADFVMHKDRVELTEAVLAGDTVGGTARGFIYTDRREYDIAGTYVPLFGLNNIFGKLLGPLAGRDGEGLFGITFAIQGPLDKPDFRVNPMSALAPGAFRRMFEFRARDLPAPE